MEIKKQIYFVFVVVIIFGALFAFTDADHQGDYVYQYEYETPAYTYEYQTPPYGYEYQSPSYQTPSYPTPGYATPYPYEYEYQYQSPTYPSPTNYSTPPPYGTPSGAQIAPGGHPCGSDAECRPNEGGVATCCNAGSNIPYPNNGSSMCASTAGGPYCYNYQYQYPTPVAYGYQTPAYVTPGTYSTPYVTPYGTPYGTPAPYGTPYGTPYVTPASGMAGTLTPASSSCIISVGSSTCNINFSWLVTNPEATSSVTSNTNNSGAASPNFVVATGHSGGPTAFVAPYSARSFYLYNNSKLLDQETVTSSCASGSTWNGTSCVANTTSCSWDPWGSWSSCVNNEQSRTRTCPCAGGCIGSYIEYQACGSPTSCTSPALSANPTIVSPGHSSILTWCSPSASCTAVASPGSTNWTGTIAGGGTMTVTPAYTTTYVLTCGGVTVQETITVRNRPWFIED